MAWCAESKKKEDVYSGATMVVAGQHRQRSHTSNSFPIGRRRKVSVGSLQIEYMVLLSAEKFGVFGEGAGFSKKLLKFLSSFVCRGSVETR